MTEPFRSQEKPVELPMLPVPAPPAPMADCTLCGLLDAWRTAHNDPRHSAYDPSSGIDCNVEIRNHPHDPPRMTLPARVPGPR
ncbi:hypothetical protein [Streptomyces sp. NPDC020965]|uniref:hypothetical protein n=1 Tax=Streptomyces sp. NPDC020965 TaxID=3365105 RepID=UPI0037A3AE67